MLKPKTNNNLNWILAGRGSINKPPIPMAGDKDKPAFNLPSDKNKAPIRGQGNK